MALRAKLELKRLPPKEEPPPARAPRSAKKAKAETAMTPPPRPDREGKKLIAGHFAKETWKTLRTLGIETEKTTQELLQEALDDLFAKYRCKPV